jgi:hypothetical protein
MKYANFLFIGLAEATFLQKITFIEKFSHDSHGQSTKQMFHFIINGNCFYYVLRAEVKV